MEVNRDAPAVATGEIEIRAEPETVWEVLSDIDRWPSWNPDVKAASLNGGLNAARHSTPVGKGRSLHPTMTVGWRPCWSNVGLAD